MTPMRNGWCGWRVCPTCRPGATKRIELSTADARHANLSHRTRGRLAWEAQRSPAIGLTNVDGHIYAYADACPHQFYSLAESHRDGTRITCDLHGWCYDISSGAPVPPVKIGLPTYRVVVEGDVISIDVRQRPPQSLAPEACSTTFDSIAHAPTSATTPAPPIISRAPTREPDSE